MFRLSLHAISLNTYTNIINIFINSMLQNVILFFIENNIIIILKKTLNQNTPI